jgi:hypothetical protein
MGSMVHTVLVVLSASVIALSGIPATQRPRRRRRWSPLCQDQVRHQGQQLLSAVPGGDRIMKRMVDVDARGAWLLVASSWATAGNYPLFIQGYWVQAVNEPVSDEQVGGLVRSALAACRDGVPCPDFKNDPELKRRRGELLKLAGARSEMQYARGTRHVSVYRDDAETYMTVTPHRREGRGFAGIGDRVTTVRADSDDAQLGAVVRQALSVST